MVNRKNTFFIFTLLLIGCIYAQDKGLQKEVLAEKKDSVLVPERVEPIPLTWTLFKMGNYRLGEITDSCTWYSESCWSPDGLFLRSDSIFIYHFSDSDDYNIGFYGQYQVVRDSLLLNFSPLKRYFIWKEVPNNNESKTFVVDSIVNPRQLKFKMESKANCRLLRAGDAIGLEALDFQKEWDYLNSVELMLDWKKGKTLDSIFENSNSELGILRTSPTIGLNNQEYYWRYTASGVGNTGTVIKQLVDNPTSQIVLSDTDFTNIRGLGDPNFWKYVEGNFMDVNFDGYLDWIQYCHSCSGSGGVFTRVYTFNPHEGLFQNSFLSGGELHVDTNNYSVSTMWKSGRGWRASTRYQFNDRGKLLFSEHTLVENKWLNSNDLWISSYQKWVNDSLVLEQIDSSLTEPDVGF